MNMKTWRSLCSLCLMFGFVVVQVFYPVAAAEETVAEESSFAESDSEPQESEDISENESGETEAETSGGEPSEQAVEDVQADGSEIDEQEINLEEAQAEAPTDQEEASEDPELELETQDPEPASTTEDVPETAATTTLEYDAEQATSTELSLASATSSDEGGFASTSSTTIVSGQSVALANVLNMVNSNFVNSEGVVLFSNFFETVFGAIDFRQYFGSMLGLGCSLVSCQGNDVVVNVDNDASIENEILVSATSGNNEITGAGNATIETGDAYAGLNLINVANTNLVDSNYLLVTLNAFQGVNGDIVFPSLSEFFSTLANGASTPEVIDIHNTAGVENDITVDANSGDNTASNINGGIIQTGNSQSSSNVFNQLNSSLVGGQSVSVVFRVHGNWAGEIFGAPDDLGWTVGDDGSIYLFDVGGASSDGSLTMHGTSTAMIHNNVNVVALTGKNAITDAETAVISTGNAYAGANVINVANANVIGRNWILAVINIFGDFNGNIAFGRPDLWVGGQVDVPHSIKNGSELSYTYTIINNGDSPATNVHFTTKLNGEYLHVTDASASFEEGQGNELSWQLGTIPAGGAAEISYTATVENTQQGTDIVNTATVRGRETDNNTADNKEIVTVRTDERRKGDGIRIELGKSSSVQDQAEVEGDMELVAQRLTPEVFMNIGNNSTEQKLVLKNTTNTVAVNVVLHDVLKDDGGAVIRDEVWELGNVLPGEEISLGYTISFNPNARYGLYTLDTLIEGDNVHIALENNGKIVYEELAEPLPIPFVLGATNDSSAAFAFSESKSDKVYYGEETPLIPPFKTHLARIANADEGNTQLASAAKSGFPLDPIVAFFTLSAALLLLSLFRMYRFR
jgi:hypothetical protein